MQQQIQYDEGPCISPPAAGFYSPVSPPQMYSPDINNNNSSGGTTQRSLSKNGRFSQRRSKKSSYLIPSTYESQRLSSLQLYILYIILFYRTTSNQNERPHYNRYEHGYYGSSCTPVEEEFIPAADDYNNSNNDENNGDESEPKKRLTVGLSDGTAMHEKILVLKDSSFSNSSEKKSKSKSSSVAKSNEASSKSNKSNNNRVDDVDV